MRCDFKFDFNKTRGRIGIIAAIVLALAALALYLYSERAVPPQPPPEPPPDETRLNPERLGTGAAEEPQRDAPPPRVEPVPVTPDESGAPVSEVANGSGHPSADESQEPMADTEEAGVSLERAHRRLRDDLTARLRPGQIEMVADERLHELVVTTINSLDGDPVPLRFRPLDHVPELPRLEADGEVWRLPEAPDPRYRPYRALFDRLGATEVVELFERYEPALEKAWRALGEDREKPFRARVIEVLEHLVDFELPDERPRLHQPEVLYEYIDPALERLSWGRKVLVRIGPEHAPAVQRKLGRVADQLARRSTRGVEEGVEG